MSLSLTVQRVGAEVRVRLSRFAPGSPYPQRILEGRMEPHPGESGREVLQRAIALTLSLLDEQYPMDERHAPDVR